MPTSTVAIFAACLCATATAFAVTLHQLRHAVALGPGMARRTAARRATTAAALSAVLVGAGTWGAAVLGRRDAHAAAVRAMTPRIGIAFVHPVETWLPREQDVLLPGVLVAPLRRQDGTAAADSGARVWAALRWTGAVLRVRVDSINGRAAVAFGRDRDAWAGRAFDAGDPGAGVDSIPIAPGTVVRVWDDSLRVPAVPSPLRLAPRAV